MKKITSIISVTLAASMALSVTGCLNKYVNPMGTAALESYAKEYGAERYKSSRDFAHFIKDSYGDVNQLNDGVYVRADGKAAGMAIEASSEIPIFYDENIKEATVFAVGNMSYYMFNEIFCVSMAFGSSRDADLYYEMAVDSYYVRDEDGIIDADEFDPRMVFDVFENDQQVEQARQALRRELSDMGASPEMVEEWMTLFDEMYDFDYDLELESFEGEDGLRYTLLTGSHGDVFYTAGIYVKNSTVFYAYGFGYVPTEVNEYLDDVCEHMQVPPPSTL